MKEEDLFVIPEEPQEDPPTYPEIDPCPFCGGSGHIQTKTMKKYSNWIPELGGYRWDYDARREKAYCFCGSCKARGPIVVKETRLTEVKYARDKLKIEAIELWNRRRQG